MKKSAALLILFFIFLTVQGQDQETPKPVAPYSQSVMTKSGILFVSGQIPINPETNIIVRDDIKTATGQVMKNIGTILKKNGMDYSNIVKCTIFLTDINDYGAVNKVYASFFEEQFPAREAIEVVNLPLGALIEISAIASE